MKKTLQTAYEQTKSGETYTLKHTHVHTHKHTLPPSSPPPRTTSTKTKTYISKTLLICLIPLQNTDYQNRCEHGTLTKAGYTRLSSLHQVQCKDTISIPLELEFQVYVSYPVQAPHIKVQSLRKQGILLTSEQYHLFQHRCIFFYKTLTCSFLFIRILLVKMTVHDT